MPCKPSAGYLSNCNEAIIGVQKASLNMVWKYSPVQRILPLIGWQQRELSCGWGRNTNTNGWWCKLGDSGRVINSLDFCPASLNSLQFFPLNFDHLWSMDKQAILAVKKPNEPSIFLREIHQGNSVWAVCVQTTSFRLFFNYNYAMQMHHFPFCLSSAYTVRAYIWRKLVLMSLQTVKCHMIVQMRRSERKRRWVEMMTVTADLDI